MDMQDLNARTLPSQLRFSDVTPLGLTSKSKKVKFLPSNAGTFSNVNNLIRIPVSSASAFLDPSLTSLKFTFKNKSTKSIQIDSSFNSCISRMRLISSSGGDLENMQHYGKIVSVLSDVQYGTEARMSKSIEGFGYASVTRGKTEANAQAAAQVLVPAITDMTLGTGESPIAADATVTTMLPLLSSLIGSSASKYFPLFMAPLMLEIELANQYMPFVALEANPVASYEVSNVELHCQLIEFDSDVNSNLAAMVSKSGLFIHGTSWCSFYNAIAGTNPSIVIMERLKSVKSILTCFTIPPDATYATRYMARHTSNLTSLQFKIGSEVFPNQPISGTATEPTQNVEYIVEMMKALGEYNHAHHTSIINSTNFASNDATAISVGKSLYGLDLDAFTKSPLESGLSTILNSPIIIQCQQAGGAIAGLVNFTFLLYDCIYHLSPDGSFVVSK